MSDTVSSSGFWEARYQSAQTGWEKGRCAPPIARLLREGLLSPGAVVAVLGCGRGHEALEAAKVGLRPTAIDFAPSAIEAVRQAAAQHQVRVETLCQDLFTLPATHTGMFDAVLEHTSFCAIDVARRAEYVDVVDALLKPGGVVFGLFYAHGRGGGPPFDSSEADVRTLFSPRFELVRLQRASDSFPERAGDELEFVFRKR